MTRPSVVFPLAHADAMRNNVHPVLDEDWWQDSVLVPPILQPLPTSVVSLLLTLLSVPRRADFPSLDYPFPYSSWVDFDIQASCFDPHRLSETAGLYREVLVLMVVQWGSYSEGTVPPLLVPCLDLDERQEWMVHRPFGRRCDGGCP